MADELNKLAERVEALTGPDREVAKLIFAAVHPESVPTPVVKNGYGWREDDAGWWLATGEDARCPRKTVYPPDWLGSLDAAILLVPPEAKGAAVAWDKTRCAATIGFGGNPETQEAEAATPPLALTAAALRAREVIAHMAGQEVDA